MHRFLDTVDDSAYRSGSALAVEGMDMVLPRTSTDGALFIGSEGKSSSSTDAAASGHDAPSFSAMMVTIIIGGCHSTFKSKVKM